ncbi:MAG: LysR family transcriptional regulator [Lachnospiraceae bacterium]|nr:LysR family transcriptional regulator [Lachnospiraceae bacterium]
MTTERLQEFTILANTLNFSRAADMLFISQSVLSKHIADLEEELQVKLFDRDTHGVRLTDEGRLLFHQAAMILEKAEKMEALVSKSHHRTEGMIQIRCHEQCMCDYVLRLIEGFKKKYESIEINTRVIESAGDISAMGDSDLLISPCDFMNRLFRDYAGKQVYAQRALLAIPPYHHFSDRREISLQELKGETLLVPFSDELFGPYARNHFLAVKKCGEALKKLPCESTADAILKVELGEGVMIIPHHLKAHLYQRTLALRITDPECTFPVFLYQRKNSGNAAAELFYESME